jgi:hypothetical protein
MKMSVFRARTLWFVDLHELNPRGRSLYPEVIAALESKYEFQRVPKSASDLTKEGGLELFVGSFEARPDEYVDVTFTVYNDGLTADTRSSTKDSEAFLQGAMDFVSKGNFGIVYDPSMIHRKAHLSEIIVHTEKTLDSINPKLAKLEKRLNELSNGALPEFRLAGITFRSDQTAQTSASPFLFERRVNVPFSENRYYSAAPFSTEDHMALLREFGDLFLA